MFLSREFRGDLFGQIRQNVDEKPCCGDMERGGKAQELAEKDK